MSFAQRRSTRIKQNAEIFVIKCSSVVIYVKANAVIATVAIFMKTVRRNANALLFVNTFANLLAQNSVLRAKNHVRIHAFILSVNSNAFKLVNHAKRNAFGNVSIKHVPGFAMSLATEVRAMNLVRRL